VESKLSISKEDFEEALLIVHPSVMNEAYIEVPKVRWSDIAGSENVKQKLWEAVDLPLQVSFLYQTFSLPQPFNALALEDLGHKLFLLNRPGILGSKTLVVRLSL
jgi:SpoVK/Ycf46/Vps4 family AAA+-type ATPase